MGLVKDLTARTVTLLLDALRSIDLPVAPHKAKIAASHRPLAKSLALQCRSILPLLE